MKLGNRQQGQRFPKGASAGRDLCVCGHRRNSHADGSRWCTPRGLWSVMCGCRRFTPRRERAA